MVSNLIYLHDNILGILLDSSISDFLYVSFQKLNIKLFVAKLLHMVGNMFSCHVKLKENIFFNLKAVDDTCTCTLNLNSKDDDDDDDDELSCVAPKPALGISDQPQHKLGCTTTEDG